MSEKEEIKNPVLFDIKRPTQEGELIAENIDGLEQVCSDDLGSEFMGHFDTVAIEDALEAAMETVKESIKGIENTTNGALKDEVFEVKKALVEFKVKATEVLDIVADNLDGLEETMDDLTAAVERLKYRAGIRDTTVITGAGNHASVTTVPGQVDWPDAVPFIKMLDATEAKNGGSETLSVNS